MLTKLIRLVLTIAALCIGVALVLLGNLYSGGVLVIFVMVAAGLSQSSRFKDLASVFHRRSALALTSAAVGAALILLAAAVGYVPGFGSAVARPAVEKSLILSAPIMLTSPTMQSSSPQRSKAC